VASVDVVVPCYNYGRYLKRCVESLLAQENLDVRVLIIDDCSTDDSAQVGAALASADRRVQFRRHDKNLGHIATYNEGLLGWAEAEYSLLISADDLVTPGSLTRATEVLDRHPEAGMAYGSATIFYDENYPELPPVPPDYQYRLAPGAQFIQRCFTVGNPVPTACAVVRTRLQRELGGYNPKLPFTADLDLWASFAGLGPIALLRPVQGLYRKHSMAMSRNYYERANRDRRELIATADAIKARLAGVFPQLPALNAALRRRFALQSCWDAGQALEDGNPQQMAECMRFSLEADPGIVSSAAWWKLRAKRLLGKHVVRGLKRLAGGEPPPPADAYSREFGWWE